MPVHQLGAELLALLSVAPEQAEEALEDIHPQDLADALETLTEVQTSKLLNLLPAEFAAQVFERIAEQRQEGLVQALGVNRSAELAREMNPDNRADFFSVLPPSLGAPILAQIHTDDPEIAEEVRDLQKWSTTSAGGLMTTEYLAIRPDITIADAIAEVRRLAEDIETLDTLFVTAHRGLLLGTLSLKRMVLSGPFDLVSEVMARNPKSVPPELDQEEVARVLAKYDLSTLAVVAEGGSLIGVITADDVLDVLTEEQSEDVHKMGAVEPIRDGYFDTRFQTFLRKRAPWLVVLFFGGFMTTYAMRSFAAELAAVTTLSYYLPLLIAAGGNSGAQSSTLIIRALAVGDVESADWWRVLWRETMQGLTLGGMLAVLGMSRAILAGDGAAFAILVGTTIILVVLAGCVIGAMIPLLLHRVRIDPATSSTPFIASLVDVMGILVYLSLAQVLLSALSGAKASPQ